jgi:small subunit ribosomal protein S9
MTVVKKAAPKKAPSKSTTQRKRVKKEDLAKVMPEAEVVPEVVAHKELKRYPVKTPSTGSFYAVGKRKTSVAQAVLVPGKGSITVNSLAFEQYFGTKQLQHIVTQPLTVLGIEKSVDIKAKVSGGGIHSQAESLRHAVSRAVTKMDFETRRTLKKHGFLKRDPRVKERKKPGLKRARRAPQFSKR